MWDGPDDLPSWLILSLPLIRHLAQQIVFSPRPICPNGHRRTVPFRLLKTSESDRTPLYGRPFKCRACGSSEVTLLAIDSQAELEEVQRDLAGPPQPAQAPTTHRRSDPDEDLP